MSMSTTQNFLAVQREVNSQSKDSPIKIKPGDIQPPGFDLRDQRWDDRANISNRRNKGFNVGGTAWSPASTICFLP